MIRSLQFFSVALFITLVGVFVLGLVGFPLMPVGLVVAGISTAMVVFAVLVLALGEESAGDRRGSIGLNLGSRHREVAGVVLAILTFGSMIVNAPRGTAQVHDGQCLLLNHNVVTDVLPLAACTEEEARQVRFVASFLGFFSGLSALYLTKRSPEKWRLDQLPAPPSSN